MADHGTFYWNELMSRDAEKAKAFYAATIGWSFEGMKMPEGGTYWIAKMNGKSVAGIMPMGPDFKGPPTDVWFAYLAVDDVDARVAKAKQAGAQIAREPFDVPGVGRIAILQEPSGAHVGWMTPAPSQS
jgi:predicted enzyme related to lactoylglutathione lyase